jgi:hypothetical protein
MTGVGADLVEGFAQTRYTIGAILVTIAVIAVLLAGARSILS